MFTRKTINVILYVVFFLHMAHFCSARSSFRFESDNKLYGADIQNNVSQSFLNTQVNYISNMAFSYSHGFGAGYDANVNLDFRLTNDMKVYRNMVEMGKVLVSFGKGDEFKINAGNIYTSFSQYTLGRSLEGADFWKKFSIGENWQLKSSIVAARHYGADATKYARYAYGIRFEGSTKQNMVAGFSAVRTFDDRASLPGGPVICIDNRVYGLDLKLPELKAGDFCKMSVEQNIAGTWLDTGASAIPQADFAYKLSATGLLDLKIEKINLGIDCEIAGPDFNSYSGSGTKDQATLGLNVRTSLGSRSNMRISYQNYHNNLRNNLTYTTNNNNAGISFDVLPVRQIQSLNLNMSYSFRRSDTSDRSSDKINHSISTSANYSLNKMNFNLGYQYSHAIDALNFSNNNQTNNISFGFSVNRLNLPLKELTISPQLRYSLQEYDINSVQGQDYTHDIRAECGFGYGNNINFNLSLGRNIADRALKLADSFMTQLNAQLIYTLNTQSFGNMTFSIDYTNRNNTFEIATKNYNESTWSAGVRYRF